jgi:hypothetical protein
MSETNTYQKDLMVDADILDLLWLKQPQLHWKYSEASAEANDLVRKKKNDLEVLYARLDQEIRISLEGEGKKTTADSVKAAILCDERHIKAVIEYNDALYRADLCGSAVKAVEHKKSALQSMVQLCLSGYTAMPKVPRDIKSELRKFDKKEEENMAEKKAEVQERASRRDRKNTGEVN